jgi:hypothetical protein
LIETPTTIRNCRIAEEIERLEPTLSTDTGNCPLFDSKNCPLLQVAG